MTFHTVGTKYENFTNTNSTKQATHEIVIELHFLTKENSSINIINPTSRKNICFPHTVVRDNTGQLKPNTKQVPNFNTAEGTAAILEMGCQCKWCTGFGKKGILNRWNLLIRCHVPVKCCSKIPSNCWEIRENCEESLTGYFFCYIRYMINSATVYHSNWYKSSETCLL